MLANQPFRCNACGAASPSATRCAQCGGASFRLAPAPPDLELALAGGQPPLGQVVPIHAARGAQRSRHRRPRRLL